MQKPRTVRVVHTADWHLGKRLCDFSREEEHRQFLTWLSDQLRTLQADILIVAGDIFDSANPPHSATSMLYQFLTTLHQETQCEVVLIGGNHDSPKQLQAVAPLLKTHRVHVCGMLSDDEKDCLIEIGEPVKAVIAAVPFLRDRDVRLGQSGETLQDIQANLIAGIKSIYDSASIAAKKYADQKIPTIATGHLTTLGSSSSDSELSIHVGGLGAFPCSGFPDDFHYVALGHLHRPQKADAAGRIQYSGSPIPLSFSEAEDNKSIQYLEFEDDRLTKLESIAIPQQLRLLCLKGDAEGMASNLKAYDWPSHPMGCLVELTITNAAKASVSLESLRELLAEKNVHILQIRTLDNPTFGDLKEDTASVEEAIRYLQNEPQEVFAQRLDTTDYSPETKERLTAAFDSLIEDVMTTVHDN